MSCQRMPVGRAKTSDLIRTEEPDAVSPAFVDRRSRKKSHRSIHRRAIWTVDSTPRTIRWGFEPCWSSGYSNMSAHKESSSKTPLRQIRAVYDDTTIRVYQAYPDAIADAALTYGTFVSPPFKMERMTWIKPSFLWMMYRSGWAQKDAGQSRILAIDISREGFEWAIAHSCPSHPSDSMSPEEWLHVKQNAPVRIQWDPERDLLLQPQAHRAIQIGLSKQAVDLYVKEWIQRITDVTPLAQGIHALVAKGDLESARSLLPVERPYGVDA